MKKKQKKSRKIKNNKKKNWNKKPYKIGGRRTKKTKKTNKKKYKKTQKSKVKKLSKIKSNFKIKKIHQDSIVLKIVKFQLSLKPI